MCSNRLQLDALKTEFIWCAPVRRRHHIPYQDVQVGHDSLFIRSSQLETWVCICRRWYDEEGTHQPRAVVVLWYTETAQVN